LDGLATPVILLQLDGIQLTNTLRLKTFGWVSYLCNPFAAGWDPVNKYLEGLKPLHGLATSVIFFFEVKNLYMG
jgi:hypothetical protein